MALEITFCQVSKSDEENERFLHHFYKYHIIRVLIHKKYFTKHFVRMLATPLFGEFFK
ncbi:hypothetical protein SAMN05216167_13436 [Spirosoma endophyticum]|uniref:Uncharacterized protein n=1 Tax=Spirosoma endophyticum TaxID=662367 RepID=A0A1I2GPW3_9BACT|nr:hypothetical protein SAMN05216167_13436 [Spirosoma endophyticum]